MRQSGGAGRLPRGRHGLPRQEVIASQRERMLRAMADVMAEKGYVGTSVATILSRAGVSRETFYEQFRSREDCFDAAFRAAVDTVLARVAAAARADASDGERSLGHRGGAAPQVTRIARILDAYLGALADEPAYARVFLVEVYAAGARAVAARADLQESFVAVIVSVLDARTEEQRFACRTLAAAIGALATARIAADDPQGLRELRDPLIDMVVRGGALYGEAVARP